mmetsp:Transcript_7554/g.18500  ORF Transcript_7554/g.18500 Transcript_7554/m.18500 type:complete len:552 (+) Transcript_7554:103-1758(+)
MTGGQRRPSYDLAIEDSAFLKHELEAIDPMQLTLSQRQKRQKQKHEESTDTKATGEEDSLSKATDTESLSLSDWDKGDIWLEARLFLELAGVSSLMNLGFISSPLLTASYIGRSFAPVYLSAFTLANLTGNLSTFSFLAGLFSASDTLSPQAFGREDFPEVGKLAIRGFVVSFSVLLPLNIMLFYYLEPIMIALGQDAEASLHASRWYKVFVFTLPFSILFNCLWKFLTAQHIMKPLILVSLLCTCVILPLSLQICINAMGFVGSAVGYAIFQISQALALLFYVYWKQPHEPRTWSGLSLKIVASALEWDQMKEFIHLGMGGIVAQCEWIFWEAVGLVVGKLGVVALSVHTIPNQTIMAFCMVPFSFGIALAIRMGISLPISVKRTQVIVLATLIFSALLFGIASIGVNIYRDELVGFFTTDDAVKELADVVWLKVSLFNFNVAIFGILVGIATGLGKQWPLGVINFVFLWLFGLPMIYYTAVVQDQGLDAAWYWMNIPYLCMNVTLGILFVFTDWNEVQEQILDTGEKNIETNGDQQGGTDVLNEKTSLL